MNFINEYLTKRIFTINNISKFMIHGLISTTLYALWLEYHPKMGNVIFRKDSTGTKRFMYKSLIQFIKLSFSQLYMWTHLIDLNYIVFVSGYYLVTKYSHKFFEHFILTKLLL